MRCFLHFSLTCCVALGPLFGHFALPNSIQLLFLNYGDFLSTYKLLELVLG